MTEERYYVKHRQRLMHAYLAVYRVTCSRYVLCIDTFLITWVHTVSVLLSFYVARVCTFLYIHTEQTCTL